MQISGTYELTMILGAATLLLWGVRMARTGVMRIYGSQIHKTLPRALDNPVIALLIGAGAATALQSSIAVAVFTSGLAAVGVIPVADGLLLLLGADAGSALVAALLTLNLKAMWPILMFVGYLLHAIFSDTASPFKQVGRIMLGIAMILIALAFMSQVSSSLAASGLIKIIVSSLGSELLIALLLFAVLTWLAHSSIAILLFWASLVQTGVTADPDLIMAALFGINLGNALPPIIMTWSQAAPARRIVFGNALFKLTGVVVGFACLHLIDGLYARMPGEPGFRVMILHILFNIALIAMFAAFVTPIARFLEKWFADPPKPADDIGPKYIPTATATGARPELLPVTALSREVLRIVGTIETMLETTLEMLTTGAADKAQDIAKMESKVDTLFTAVRAYAVDLTRKGMSDEEQHKVTALLRYTASLENVGDVISKAMVGISKSMKKAGRSFSPEGKEEIATLFHYLIGNTQLAAEVIMAWNQDTAGVLVQRKRELKKMCTDSSERHFARLSEGISRTMESSSAHLELILNIRWINGQVSCIAYEALPGKEPVDEGVVADLNGHPE